MRSKVYEKILASMPIGLEKVVLQVLVDNDAFGQDKRILRRNLAALVGQACISGNIGYQPPASLDRKVRLAIVELQQQGYPILSSAGIGGYWLASSQDEVETVVAELSSRVSHLTAKINALRNGQVTQSLREAHQTNFLDLAPRED